MKKVHAESDRQITVSSDTGIVYTSLFDVQKFDEKIRELEKEVEK